MKTRYQFFAVLGLIGLTLQPAWGDPCGMVPPIYPGQQIPLARVGLQQTYVFYKDGVETFVIRPGFTGKVDEFGMLIPFPTPPAIRKVPDHIFGHIAAAVDPPEVVVDLTPRPQLLSLRGAAIKENLDESRNGLEFERVKVLRQEAVGMYEVAVLEAGSSAALKRWMDDHKYKYPDGMDKPVDDYVKEGWCFVAIKTKVGQKDGVDPKPGQRTVNSKLPSGSTFDGHVQGMGFRFKVDELVVPMRLSAFNKGELRNIVYLITDGPRKIRSIPEEYVVRQISGEQLIKNLTEPLPLRIIGGTEADIPEYRRKQLPAQRNPVPKNGAAGELFASDLLAVTTGKLALPHEEREKELLRIGERFGLRGGDIDKLNVQSLDEERKKTVEQALSKLKGMTLSVVDGDFPRELLGRENLTFAEYKMPAKRNRPEKYDAKLNAPAPKKKGILKVGALSPLNQVEGVAANSSSMFWTLSLLSVGLFGLVLTIRLRHRLGRSSRLAVLFALVALTTSAATIAQDKADDKKPTIRELVNQLSDADKAEEAIKALVARAEEAKPQLMGEAIEGNDLARRGWAIAALAEIGGKDVDELLAKVHADDKQSMLVRTWATAARVYMTEGTDNLIQMASLVQTFPAVGRPLGMRVIEGLTKDKEASPEGILSVSLKVPQLQQALVPTILALGPEKLIKVMTTAKEQKVRFQATAYIGTLAQNGDKTVGKAVADAYKFDPDAKAAPWSGGPLYVPGIQWNKDDATLLVDNLIAWHLWCDRNKKASEQQQIYNNLRSIGLSRVVGYQTPQNTTVAWLMSWGKVVGREGIEKILKEQGVEDEAKYSSVLENL